MFNTLKEWHEYCRQQTHDRNSYVSTHVDQLLFTNINALEGNSVLHASGKLLDEINQLFLSYPDEDQSLALLVLPLGYSDKITFWDDSFTHELGKADEPVSLYFCTTTDIFEIDDEEYKCSIPGPLDGITAIYRCHRSRYAAEQNWEFSLDIYVFSRARVGTISEA